MTDQYEIKEWIKSNCPLLWSLLNTKVQRNLPKGLSEYIGVGMPAVIETARDHFGTVERYLTRLKNLCSWETIEDNYRRHLSGVDSESQVAELFCEIALCASLGKVFSNLHLHPSTGKGTFSDCLFNFQGFDIYCEAKRYADPWPPIVNPGDVFNEEVPFSRSIARRPQGERQRDSARPRSMNLRSKLLDAHRQFPERNLNILFIFHPSLTGETQQYLTQVLFGDSNFFPSGDGPVLEPDGLFSIEKWRNISACCLARVDPTLEEVIFPVVWKNPCALLELPTSVLEAFSRMHNKPLHSIAAGELGR
jgi:hypothetical protein